MHMGVTGWPTEECCRILDNLPAAVRVYGQMEPNDVRYMNGFRLGETILIDDKEAHIVFNHIHFIISYHHETDSGARIVGFQVEPHSVQHSYDQPWDDKNPPKLLTCNPQKSVDRSMPLQFADSPGQVFFTYDVEWVESDVPWANRWELYFRGFEEVEVHWFSIVNSIVIVLFLSGIVAMIMVRVLHRDISRINDETDEDETGWKLIHGDVFRPPVGFLGPMALSVLVGSGVQMLTMAITVMVFGILGVLSPANRGALLTALVVIFLAMGIFAGFVSSVLYKMFLGKQWYRNALLTATVFPGTVAAMFMLVNTILWSRASTGAIPFGTMIAVLALWFFISIPLVFLGAYLGFTREAIAPATRINTFARPIPQQPWFLSPLVTCMVGSIVPFGAVFIELYFIMSSVWLSEPYYLFGFLALVLVLLIITCMEISIVMCYFQLCAEDHRWWWRSFLTSGGSAVYLFLYSIMYFGTRLEITDGASAMVYFGNMALVSWAFFLLTGSIGFISTLVFIRFIYSRIKIE
jgi:transmembrane 9 superfamily member 2/4